MQLEEVLWQHRNDFEGILKCEHCKEFQLIKHGYMDDRFLEQVIPAIKCIACGKRGVEEIPEGISDPGTQGGIPASRVQTVATRWVLKRDGT